MATHIQSESSHILLESTINRVCKQRVVLQEGDALLYCGTADTAYTLRLILSFLGLKTSGTKSELIERIEDHGINPGEYIWDHVSLGERLTPRLLHFCPHYLIKVYLRKHNIPISGTKDELTETVRQHMISTSQDKIVPPIAPEDKKAISDIIHTLYRGGKISESDVDLMALHGYKYDEISNTFFDTATSWKVLGDRTLAEEMRFAFSSPLLDDTKRLVSS